MASRGQGVGVAFQRGAHDGDTPRVLALDELRERHPREEPVHGAVELFPKVVRHAAAVLLAVFSTAALRRVEGLLHRADDVGDRDPGSLTCGGVYAAPPPPPLH